LFGLIVLEISVHSFGPMGHIMAGEHGGVKLLTCGQEENCEREKD
jgi:hypothetical protein